MKISDFVREKSTSEIAEALPGNKLCNREKFLRISILKYFILLRKIVEIYLLAIQLLSLALTVLTVLTVVQVCAVSMASYTF